MSLGKYFLVTERLPVRDGDYEVQYNTDVNGGRGKLRFTKRGGWMLPKAVRKMYKVVGWWENLR